MTDPALSDLGKEALRDLLANLTQAKAFVLDQAPEFCRQLITRDFYLNLTSGCVLLVGSIILVVGGALAARRGMRLFSDSDMVGELHILPGVFAILAGIAAFCGGSSDLYLALSIHLAPKVYLVEQIAKMIK